MGIMPRPKGKKRQREDSEEVDDEEADNEDGGSDVEQDEAEIAAMQVSLSHSFLVSPIRF